MARIAKQGAGITARTVRRLDHRNPEDAAEIAADEAAAKAYAQAVELDDFFGSTTMHIRAFLASEIERAGPQPWPEEGPADFARRILDRIELADRVIKGGSAGLAARFAFEAGDLWRAAVMKWEWELAAMSGAKYLAASAEGSAKRLGTTEPHVLAVLAEMERLTGAGHTASRAAEITAGRGIGTSKTANLAAWNRRNRAERKAVTHP